MRILPALALLLFLGGCRPAQTAPEIQFLNSDAYREMGVPFSEAVRVGNLLFLSGQVGNVPGTFELVEGGIEAETRQIMENIRSVLTRYGSDLDHVVKCTVFVADMAEWGALNAIYRTYFTNLPARSALGANGLALNARAEIECIAVIP